MKMLLDSSVMSGGQLNSLCLAAASNGHELLVPALVYTERVFQIRRSRGTTFKQEDIDAWFAKYVGILSVEPLGGDGLAERMFARWPSDEDWKSVKRKAYRACAGQDPDQDYGTKRCGATLDLYLSSAATPEVPIVTEDKQFEWKGLAPGCVLSLEQALERLGSP